MRADIHPKWFPEARVICACGTTFTVGATVPEIHTELCSACHPFFTGEQRIVDTAGQVERFMRRLEVGAQQRDSGVAQAEARKQAELEAKRKRRGLTPITPPRRRATKAAPAPAEAEAGEPNEG